MTLAATALLAAGLSCGKAGAADFGNPAYPSSFGAPTAPIAPQPFISEIRLGSFVHDADSPESGSVDINGEILFAKPLSNPGSPWDFLIPRPSVGATINTAGKTSHAYAGLTWTYDITHSIFVEASFGGSLNNGKTGAIVPPDRSAMGCHLTFRESASVGYRLSDNWSVMGTVEHMSNAGLCNANRGLTNYGARIGYSF